jgi:hypothetical protein
MEPLPPSWSNSTIAAYYLHGIEAGLFEADCAKQWAFGIVEALDEPPIEIIDVAVANRRAEAIASLAIASELGDLPRAGAKLLSVVGRQLQSGALPVRAAIRVAAQVANSTSMAKDVRDAIDSLEHEVGDVERGVFGSVAEISESVVEELLRFDSAGAI